MFARMYRLGFCVAALCGLVLTACNFLPVPGTDASGGDGSGGQVAAEISQARRDTARVIINNAAVPIVVNLLQRDLADAKQKPCFPLGLDFGGDGTFDPFDYHPWPSRLGKDVDLTDPHPFGLPIVPNFVAGEFDFLFSPSGETDYILAIRSKSDPLFPMNFTQLEFTFRGVNSNIDGHAPGTTYTLPEARYPSNDDAAANRSLIDLQGGDIAVIVHSLIFEIPLPQSTQAWMNFLGPTAYVLFMRDNAFQSGRFYALTGAVTGGPPASTLNFTPPGPFTDGFFESVQVNGMEFDNNSRPGEICDGLTPTADYGFADFSQNMPPGSGNFLFVARREAFQNAGNPVPVVLDPSAAPGTLAEGQAANLIGPLKSGYDETNVPGTNPGFATDHAPGGIPDGPAGVHEIGLSVFFIHSSP